MRRKEKSIEKWVLPRNFYFIAAKTAELEIPQNWEYYRILLNLGKRFVLNRKIIKRNFY